MAEMKTPPVATAGHSECVVAWRRDETEDNRNLIDQQYYAATWLARRCDVRPQMARLIALHAGLGGAA